MRMLFQNLFGKRDELDIYKEEQIQSPTRTIIRTFASNKLSMTALIGFVILLLIVIIGPMLYPVDLAFSEQSQQNISPGQNMMSVPPELVQNGIRDIAVGRTFSVGVDDNGEVYIWGKTNVPGTNVTNVPEDLPPIARVAAGFDHVVAIGEDGQIYGWGNNRQRQIRFTRDVQDLGEIIDIAAGYQSTAILDGEGVVHFFGNTNLTEMYEYNQYQGQIKDVVLTNNAAIGLLDDGTPVYLGSKPLPYSTRIPDEKFIKLAATNKTVAGLTADGRIIVWGSPNYKGEAAMPDEFESQPIDIAGGQYHYVVKLENGNLAAWGDNTYRQSTVPASINDGNNQTIYTGYYQNYAVKEDGTVQTFGLKGYLLGSDGMGRDMWQRILNGGRWTMTIGALAVLIATIIGIVVGGVSGYFGGRVDILLQRISEIVSSLPFLPFVIILNVIIGNSLGPTQRIYLIMIVLGLLSWPGLQRLVRAQVFSVREQEYITAARSMGIREYSIIFRHIIPNVISVIIVSTTLSFASSMLTESSLSFLGFGVRPPIPTWGNMLYGANNSVIIQQYWWQWVFPAIALSLTVIFVNLIGDGLRDAIDPKSQER
ncbi:MAG: ABC transporter permease subunit [Tissierellia bacterium]|nr:ABC transporter permease subunit [Tissierellia bacterium]